MKHKFRSGRELSIGKRTLIMGILNATPDSFSDGGQWIDPVKAVRHVEEMIEDGADIIDIGAESTRPDAQPIGAEEELARLEPILRSIKDIPIPISVDTYKVETARAALELGADFINAVHCDRSMLETAARLDVPIVLMHDFRSTDADIIDDVKNFFDRALESVDALGFDREKIIFDPGIGFGKSQAENLSILRRLEEFREYHPLLLGVSRKSVIGYALGLPVEQRDEATGIWSSIGAVKGADIVRVHNVKLIAPMIRAADALRSE